MKYFPKMLEMMTPIYAKQCTRRDLDGLIAFTKARWEENGFDETAVDFKGGDGRGAAVGRRIWQSVLRS